MRIRRFVEQDATTALRKVKQTLGPEAVILATRQVASGVEITAATDADLVTAAAMPDAGTESDLAAVVRELRELGARVGSLDRTLRPLRALDAALSVEARTLAERLLTHGLAAPLASEIASRFESERRGGSEEEAAVAASLARRLAPSPGRHARITAFVGPTGSGKTTTIAKLAATRAASGNARPALVMADTYRIGAAEQLGSYARLLGVPMVTAGSADELAQAIAGLAEHDTIYVDTAGLGGDGSAGADLARLLAGAGSDLTVAAVISATTAEPALRGAWRRLAPLAPSSCVVTKVDESGGAGAVCGWVAEQGVTLGWLGTGQRVPEDLAPATGRALAHWLLAV